MVAVNRKKAKTQVKNEKKMESKPKVISSSVNYFPGLSSHMMFNIFFFTDPEKNK